MKKYILTIVYFIMVLLFSNCNKEEIEYADENIVISRQPTGFSVYKTNKDYFNYIAIGFDGNIVTMYPDYDLNSPRITIEEDGSITYNLRWRLKSGYIVGKGINIDRVFTDITFQELIEQDDISSSWFKQRIIDEEPFTEYYWLGGLNLPNKEFTLGEINEMCEDGTLETVFVKLK